MRAHEFQSHHGSSAKVPQAPVAQARVGRATTFLKEPNFQKQPPGTEKRSMLTICLALTCVVGAAEPDEAEDAKWLRMSSARRYVRTDYRRNTVGKHSVDNRFVSPHVLRWRHPCAPDLDNIGFYILVKVSVLFRVLTFAPCRRRRGRVAAAFIQSPPIVSPPLFSIQK